MHVFEYRSKSKVWTAIHGAMVALWIGIFLYIGCILQLLSLTKAESVVEMSKILFIGAVWSNLLVKETVFMLKKRALVKLWQRLGDEDFRAKTKNELQ